MPTYMVVTTLSGEEAATALALRIESQLSSVTATVTGEIEDGSGLWEVAGYFDHCPDELRLSLLIAAAGADARPFVISELPETGWVERAQRQLAPVSAGRFFVHGRHDADKKPTDATSLLVEAAMAFGTGHHGTTRGCLLAIDRLAREGHAATRILDLGCGTAILAMAAARVFDAEVIASDIDPSAVETAQANVARERSVRPDQGNAGERFRSPRDSRIGTVRPVVGKHTGKAASRDGGGLCRSLRTVRSCGALGHPRQPSPSRGEAISRSRVHRTGVLPRRRMGDTGTCQRKPTDGGYRFCPMNRRVMSLHPQAVRKSGNRSRRRRFS